MEDLLAERGIILTYETVRHRVNSQEARRTCPEQTWGGVRRKHDQLNAVVTLRSLAIPPGNELESLKGNRAGQHSIRINQQFRVCFVWTEDGPAYVEITDYHEIGV